MVLLGERANIRAGTPVATMNKSTIQIYLMTQRVYGHKPLPCEYWTAGAAQRGIILNPMTHSAAMGYYV